MLVASQNLTAEECWQFNFRAVDKDNFEGMVLQDLIAQVAGSTGQLPAGMISAFLVNGRNCAFRKGLETEIADGEVVEMLPVITGG